MFVSRTDVDVLLDDIVAKEPLITPSKMEQVRKLILSILLQIFTDKLYYGKNPYIRT